MISLPPKKCQAWFFWDHKIQNTIRKKKFPTSWQIHMKFRKSKPTYPQNHAFEILWLIVLITTWKLVAVISLCPKILINFVFTIWKFGCIPKLDFYLGLHNQKELLSVDLDCHSSFIKSSADYFWQKYWILEGLPSAVNFLRVNTAGIPKEIQFCLNLFMIPTLLFLSPLLNIRINSDVSHAFYI